MINGKSVLAVIPARGGSKRVPRKNLREYQGKLLIEWAWFAAMRSKYIYKLFLSTDDEEIAAVGRRYNITVLTRPPELATDDASTEDVLRHALKVYPADWVVLLQPTSPLRTSEDIDACIERAQMGNGCISTNMRGEPNGAVYVATAEWISKHEFSHLGLTRYRMPESRCLDINTEEDFAFVPSDRAA